MKLILHTFDLPLKHTFTIAHNSRSVQETLIVELTDGTYSGFGEATANPYYNATIESMSEDLKRIQTQIESASLDDVSAFWEKFHPHLKQNPFAQCALDMAAWDLFGKQEAQPLHTIWGLDSATRPLSNFTIGIDTIEKMVAKMKEQPWPLYKIKLGTSEDIEIVKALRAYTDATFRVDANCAWGVEETINNAKALKALDVEFIEQPMKADDWEGMKAVYEHSVLPLIADESCIIESDVVKCHQHFHGVNVKLTKCGGLTPALRMLKNAKTLGMKTMVGCMTESSVGIAAIAQLTPMLDYVDMDGAMLLAEDVASGAQLEDGKVIFPQENGTGARLIVPKTS